MFFQNLMIDKACLVNLNFTKDICSNLTHHRDYEEQVEVITANLNMYLNILTAIPAIITGWVLGPWSDSYGRKPLMIIPLIGYSISQFVFIINTYLTFLKAEYLLITSIGSICGGFTGFLIGMYGYISDSTDEESRTSRIAFIDFAANLGYPLGMYVSGPLFTYGGYYSIFGLVSFRLLVTCIYM